MSRPSASDKNVSVNSAPILSLGIKQIIGPLLRFAVIFGLLVVPWPGWNEIYGSISRRWETPFSAARMSRG